MLLFTLSIPRTFPLPHREVYVAIFQRLELTGLKVSLLTDDSSGDFPVYHRLLADVFTQQDIDLVLRDVLPRRKFLTNGYGTVSHSNRCSF